MVGCSLERVEPQSKRLEFEPPTKWSNLSDHKTFSEILEDESEKWYRVSWRFLEEEFLGSFIWLKDHSEMVEGFVER